MEAAPSGAEPPTVACFGGVFSVDGVRHLVTLSTTHLKWSPVVPTSSTTPQPPSSSENPPVVAETVDLPIAEACVVTRAGPRSFTLHALRPNPKDPASPRLHSRHDFALVGPHPSLRIPVPTETESEPEPISAWIRELRSALVSANGDPATRRPLLVMVNPFSGTKKAGLLWQTECAPLIAAAGLRFEVVETTRAGDAYEKMKVLDCQRYSAVACVGGDGVLNECINGLMAREDWEQAIATPVASIAAGTGNAVTHSLYGTLNPACACCHIVHNTVLRMDLFLAAQPTRQQYVWGCMGAGYGIVAEADFGSERIRWLGALRPSIWAFYRIMCGSVYRCRITYLPSDIPRQNWYGVKCGRNCQLCREQFRRHEDKEAASDFIDAASSAEQAHRESKQQETTTTPEPKQHDSPAVKPLPAPPRGASKPGSPEMVAAKSPCVTPRRMHGDCDFFPDGLTGVEHHYDLDERDASVVAPKPLRADRQQEQSAYGPAFTMSTTPTIDWVDDLPSNFAKLFDFPRYKLSEGGPPAGWAQHDNLSVSFCTFQKLPWLMPGMLVAPYAHQLDGCMDLAYATSEAFSRVSFMKFFGTFADGAHVTSPKCTYLKVKSFTIEPLDQDGYLGIDGERVHFASVQFYIAQGLFRTLCYS